MNSCCGGKDVALEQLRCRRKTILQLVLGVNSAMFCLEITAGLYAHSSALLADSLDMLGDAMVYGLSLYAAERSAAWKARAAAVKAIVMGICGAIVLGHAMFSIITPGIPHLGAMSAIGALALSCNGLCFLLLWRHRTDDINMRSVWLCSRNDLIANLSVLLAAGMVWVWQSPWPDALTGTAIGALFIHSAWLIGREALAEMRKRRTQSFIPPCCSACRGLLITGPSDRLSTPRFSR